jgi:hypothetical protein
MHHTHMRPSHDIHIAFIHLANIYAYASHNHTSYASIYISYIVTMNFKKGDKIIVTYPAKHEFAGQHNATVHKLQGGNVMVKWEDSSWGCSVISKSMISKQGKNEAKISLNDNENIDDLKQQIAYFTKFAEEINNQIKCLFAEMKKIRKQFETVKTNNVVDNNETQFKGRVITASDNNETQFKGRVITASDNNETQFKGRVINLCDDNETQSKGRIINLVDDNGRKKKKRKLNNIDTPVLYL